MTKNFAHRGFCGKYPENTMLAFEKAVEAGVDGIELDVHLSKDGVAVIIHDETVNRTCDGTGTVSKMTLEEMQKLDAHAIFKGEYPKCNIPTLEEYLQYVKDLDIITNIELKTNINEYAGIEQIVYDLIMQYNLKDRVIISSFNHYSVLRMKDIDKTIKCGLLSESWLVDSVNYVKNQGVECYHPIYGNLLTDEGKKIINSDLEINTFTVNDMDVAKELIELGVDVIITNFPDKLAELLDGYK